MARDTRALTDECEHFDEPSPEAKYSAQRVVCSYASNAAEAKVFLQMLGIGEAQKIGEGPALTPGRLQ